MEHPTIRKAALRLLPFLFLLYVIAYLDRVNVGFAKLDMNTLPWFSESIYGFGAGIFFGYFLFEVPSNLILEKVGARKWIARIMFTWGIISMAMALVKGVPSFYGLRFLLGVAEAGFFPGVLLYLTYWFTQKERAQVVALFMTANAVAFIIGAPLSGWITQATHNWLGLFGWQWLFILEGFPSVLFGFVVLAFLPDGPHDAKWLTPEERDYIQSRLGKRTDRQQSSDEPLMKGLVRDLKVVQGQLGDSQILHCFTLFFFMVGGMYGINFWIPQIVKDMSGGGSDLIKVGLLTAIPYSISACVMVLNARHSDKTGERRLHIAIPAMIGAIAMASSGLPGLPMWAKLALMAVAASGMWAILGPFWAIPQLFLKGTAMAAGLALINSVGNLAGFAGPFLVGWVKDKTGGFMYPLMVLGLFSLCGSLLAILLPPQLRRRRDEEPN